MLAYLCCIGNQLLYMNVVYTLCGKKLNTKMHSVDIVSIALYTEVYSKMANCNKFDKKYFEYPVKPV